MPMVVLDGEDSDGNAINVSTTTAFADIKRDVVGRNIVYCSTPQDNFSAGESVEIDPPFLIPGSTYSAQVATILMVNQQSTTQMVLLSLFISRTDEMGIDVAPPRNRNYIEYPSQHLVWTRYQGWFPTMRVRREALFFTPFEVNSGMNNAQVAIGMANAYCIVAKWHHNLNPTRQFEFLGHGEQDVPGSLRLIDVGCVTHRYWTFRSTVAGKIADVLSKPSLATRTSNSIHLDAISEFEWQNFKKNTIPLEASERDGVITTRTIRKTLTIEMLRGSTTKHSARFDTLERLDLLRGYFGASILGAARVRRFSGPLFSRRKGPNPSYKARRLTNEDSVGAFLGLPESPITTYRSNKPGIDVLYVPAKRQFTVRLRYVTAAVTNAVVLQQLLHLPPLQQILMVTCQFSYPT